MVIAYIRRTRLDNTRAPPAHRGKRNHSIASPHFQEGHCLRRPWRITAAQGAEPEAVSEHFDTMATCVARPHGQTLDSPRVARLLDGSVATTDGFERRIKCFGGTPALSRRWSFL